MPALGWLLNLGFAGGGASAVDLRGTAAATSTTSGAISLATDVRGTAGGIAAGSADLNANYALFATAAATGDATASLTVTSLDVEPLPPLAGPRQSQTTRGFRDADVLPVVYIEPLEVVIPGQWDVTVNERVEGREPLALGFAFPLAEVEARDYIETAAPLRGYRLGTEWRAMLRFPEWTEQEAGFHVNAGIGGDLDETKARLATERHCRLVAEYDSLIIDT